MSCSEGGGLANAIISRVAGLSDAKWRRNCTEEMMKVLRRKWGWEGQNKNKGENKNIPMLAFCFFCFFAA